MSKAKNQCVAIIPARGGSKGIPRKNVRTLAGKPLLAWTIEAALGASRVNRVIVSTDDREIADVAREFGAEVIWRPEEISGDAASSESALLHVLEELMRTEAYEPELIAFLQCTSPLTASADVDGTIEALLDGKADSALSVAPFHYFVWMPDEEGSSVGVNHDKSCRPRRQDREAQYLETGAVYVMKADGFSKSRHRFFGRTLTYVMPSERTLEIDDPRDLIVAESLLRLREQNDLAALLPRPVRGVVFDFDGVFTDNGVWLDQEGREAVVCRRDDGMGIGQLKSLGVPILVLSSEVNPVVGARCRKLGIECIQGIREKQPALAAWAVQNGIDRKGLVYVGNDINDVECLRWAGCGVVVADAYPHASAEARMMLTQAGGRGAVRELCELVIRSAQAGGSGQEVVCKAA
ncbi:MAG TPA: acylneuraminate cytidylyltransferase [Tepidisphaeraceae bacterium]